MSTAVNVTTNEAKKSLGGKPIGFGMINYIPGQGIVRIPVEWLVDHGNGMATIKDIRTGQVYDHHPRRYLNLKRNDA
jgi:hypothetical protein